MSMQELIAAYVARKNEHGYEYPDGSGYCIAEDHTGHGHEEA